jgi:hypothetical protein
MGGDEEGFQIEEPIGHFCASFATNREQFHKLDSWIRMRLRAMKFKRKNTLDNYKLRIRTFQQPFSPGGNA